MYSEYLDICWVKQYLEQGLPIPKGAKRQRTIPSLYHYAEREMRENEEYLPNDLIIKITCTQKDQSPDWTNVVSRPQFLSQHCQNRPRQKPEDSLCSCGNARYLRPDLSLRHQTRVWLPGLCSPCAGCSRIFPHTGCICRSGASSACREARDLETTERDEGNPESWRRRCRKDLYNAPYFLYEAPALLLGCRCWRAVIACTGWTRSSRSRTFLKAKERVRCRLETRGRGARRRPSESPTPARCSWPPATRSRRPRSGRRWGTCPCNTSSIYDRNLYSRVTGKR